MHAHLLLAAAIVLAQAQGGETPPAPSPSASSPEAAASAPLAVAAAPSPLPATACNTAAGRKLTVGPGKGYPTIRVAAEAAMSGDVIEISAGDYIGDVATWPQSNLTICGFGGRARLFANGRHAAGKGIWVIQGTNVIVDSIEFHNASVPDRNGAGIRAEGDGLTIINSGFYDGENGILGPNRGHLTIVRSEFARNGFGDGYTHNVYVGYADKVSVVSSFFHQAKIGHNFKSRAKETHIENSYFMDGPAGTASYQIDAPNGGVVALRGNMLQKGPRADNSTLINFGSEGLRGSTHTLTLTHNTLVSTYPGGAFLSVVSGVGSVTLSANLFAGTNATIKYIGGASPAKVTEANNLASTASNITAPTSVSNPNFWPVPALAKQTILANVSDRDYTADAPSPFGLRPIDPSQRRRVGALQSPP